MNTSAFRIGYGIDYHQLVKDREFWLGGILIENEVGGLGHSDADVLLHAICDALLGALALGDIGTHFPDNDPQYKNVDSKILLRKTYELILHQGYQINNIDATICLETPKLSPYIPEMKSVIAEILHTTENQISIKATTAEKMGFVGRKEGIAAHAVALLVAN